MALRLWDLTKIFLLERHFVHLKFPPAQVLENACVGGEVEAVSYTHLMPLMAVTEVAIPAFLQRMAFTTVSSAVTPLQNFSSNASLPLSRPMYTIDVYKRQPWIVSWISARRSWRSKEAVCTIPEPFTVPPARRAASSCSARSVSYTHLDVYKRQG